MSLATPLRSTIARAGQVAPAAPPATTYNGLVDALGGIVASHWTMPASGTVVTDRKGLQNATLSGTVQYLPVPIVQSDSSGRAIGVGAAGGMMSVPANAALNATSGAIGFTFQCDQVGTAQQILFARAGNVAGGFAVEFKDLGLGFLQLRCFRYDSAGTLRTIVGTVPSAGDAHTCFMSWGSNGLILYVDDVIVGSNGTTAWATDVSITANPLAFVQWPDSGAPFDGCAGHMILISGTQPTQAQLAPLAVPQNIAWSVDIDAGSVSASTLAIVDPKVDTAHFKQPIVPAVIAQGALGTASVSSQNLQYAAGGTAGNNDTFTYRFTSANGQVSNIATVTIDVTAVAAGLTMLGSWPLNQTGTSGTADSFSDATGLAALGAANNATLNVPSWTIPTHTKDRPGIVTGSSDNTSLEISNGGPSIPMVTGYRQNAMSFVIYTEFYSEQRGTQYWNEAHEQFGREVIACCDPNVNDDPSLPVSPAGSWCIYRRRTASNQATWRLGGYVRGASGAKNYFGSSLTGITSFNYLCESLGSSNSCHRIVLSMGPAGASLWFDNTQFTLPAVTQGWAGLTQAITIGCTPHTGHANKRSPMWGRVDQVEVWSGQINPTSGGGSRPTATTSLRYKIPAGAVLFNVSGFASVQAAIDAADDAPGSNNWVIQTDTTWRQNPFRTTISMKTNCRGLIGVMMRKAPNESSTPPSSEQGCNDRSDAEGYSVEILQTVHSTVGGGDPWAASGGWRYIGCKFDGNARNQNWSPNKTRDGTVYCGFNLQFAFCSKVLAEEEGDGDTVTVTHDLCDFFDSTAEGVSVKGRSRVDINSCRMYGTFRKAMVIDTIHGAHLTARVIENFASAAKVGGFVDNGGGLIDIEPFGGGLETYTRHRSYDCWTDGQIDDGSYQMTGESTETWYTNVHMLGGWLSIHPVRAGTDRHPAESVIFQRCTLAYYRKGFTSNPDAAGGTFPLMLQAFTDPGALFEECVFLASGHMQYGVGNDHPYNPVTDDGALICHMTYQTASVDAGRLMTWRNCEVRGTLVSHVSRVNRRCIVFPSIPSSRSIEIDGLLIDQMFADAPIVLGGLTLRHRNVVHEGRPGAAINTICTGGTYVAI